MISSSCARNAAVWRGVNGRDATCRRARCAGPDIITIERYTHLVNALSRQPGFSVSSWEKVGGPKAGSRSIREQLAKVVARYPAGIPGKRMGRNGARSRSSA